MNNPFASLGTPPPGDDPKAQLEYLKSLVEAFAQTGETRLKPIRAKLEAALGRFAQAGERAGAAQAAAERFAADIARLRMETYELLLTMVNQTRATLRIQLGRAMPEGKRIDAERLQKGLGSFAQGLRHLVASMKSGDESKRGEASRLLDEAGKLMEESGRELTEG